MAIIGIDLGTTNSLAVCYRDGKAEIIKNSLGDIYTPSAVSIDDNGEILVGRIAGERLISHPDVTAAEFKRSMGLRKNIVLDKKNFSPEELSSLVLKKIKEDAEKYLGEEITEAVISVPAYFDDNCRNATKLAAKLAGLKTERLVNEPSAAALAYQAEHDFADGTYMIVDFGGGTLDVSIVDSFDSVMEILAVAGNNHLGGKDFNEAVADHFCKSNGIDRSALSADDRAIVYRLAEQCKIALTTQPVA
ncbi:MAG: Hsp70 family protein, partial [Oscillospiraceae bacterium]|nr:Hsp70 family protein [Oscillospiraceae bacterium]